MSSLVTLFVSSLDTRSERRFDLQLPISQLKGKLEPITGIPVGNQQLAIYNSDADIQPTRVLDDDQRPLGFYSPADFQVLKVVDTNPSATFTGQLTDLSGVEKFELSDEQYAVRQDSVLAYKQRHKVGRFAEKTEPTPPPTIDVNIPIGSRCEVESTEPGLHKRGTVRFVGPTDFGGTGGIWVGVEYDEPMGKNDGSVQGKRYFTCAPKFGVFVRPDKVMVGDFPVEDPFADEEM
ncbi:CAP Gly-rich domain-containing protein [Lactarius deliciosus]|nr:CAP Gly-rich domain-containing protein [Lactarius deliciosus]